MDILLNALITLRLSIIPLMLIFALAGHRPLFIIFFIITMIVGLSFDILARIVHKFTEKRSILFGWCNFITLNVIVICVWILWPEIMRKDMPFLVVLMVSHFVPVILGFLKYNRLISYHTWTTRTATVLFACAALYVIMHSPINTLALEITIPFYIFAKIEEIAITTILPGWEYDVPSLWHAISLERGRAKEETIKAEEKLRTVLANIDDGYFEMDIKGNLTFFNPSLCKYSGYSEEELTGMNIKQLMSDNMVKKAEGVFDEVFRTGKASFGSDWQVLCKDGEIRYFANYVSLMRNLKGEPIGFRCIGHDITERKHAEEAARTHREQLYQASKMVALGTLVSGVAHEVNNPNNFIRINAPILAEAWEGMRPILDEYYRDNGDFTLAGMDYSVMRDKIPLLLAGIDSGSNRIMQIVQDLKNYVKQDLSGINNSVDLNKVVESALSLISNMIQKSTKHFSVNYEKDLPNIKGNFQRLEQVVINLVQNACQALLDSEKAVSVTTDIDRKRNCVFIIVEDEGFGIPEKNLPRIMESFFTTKQDLGGLGLGLSISRRIVEEHGGKIAFQSEEGRGTRVEVMLPSC
jgi:PAS domain S-box-containing protein